MGQTQVVDPDTAAFSAYVSDVERLNGMYRGVADFCAAHAQRAIVAQSDAAWQRNNGPYVDSVDRAIERFAAARVEPNRRTDAIEQLKANARGWYQAAHDHSKLLDRLQQAEDKAVACSDMLGVMSSESFYLKKMFPQDDEYYARNLAR
ncbi:MAG: hypothetical protein JSS29_12380 [Proteobacteria bacterium]|nr:hypothetical protein [Pseudomonadota bacterium]